MKGDFEIGSSHEPSDLCCVFSFLGVPEKMEMIDSEKSRLSNLIILIPPQIMAAIANVI